MTADFLWGAAAVPVAVAVFFGLKMLAAVASAVHVKLSNKLIRTVVLRPDPFDGDGRAKEALTLATVFTNAPKFHSITVLAWVIVIARNYTTEKKK